MKKSVIYVLAVLAVVMSSCESATTYSDLLAKEKELIQDYIKREGIQIVDEVPADWGEKIYCSVEGYDNLYYHMVSLGDTTSTPIDTYNTIVLRYREYTLTTYPDTISFWTTEDSTNPVEFRYYDTSTGVPTAWHIIVGLMKYSGSECKFICPSKLGSSTANTNVTPYGYDMSIKIKRF